MGRIDIDIETNQGRKDTEKSAEKYIESIDDDNFLNLPQPTEVV
jgi:hypothetical protein